MFFMNRLFLIVLFSGLVACSSNDDTLKPSGGAITSSPEKDVPFSKYVADTESQIKHVLASTRSKVNYEYTGEYSIEDAAKMRAPFEIAPSDTCTEQSNIGFLFVHGLTDSPFLMKDIANGLHKEKYPCATMRGLVLPGHSTSAGDTLNMKHEDWTQAVRYGMSTLINDDNVDHIYLVGFSTGTSLIVREMAEAKPSTDKIKGLIMLSAAMKAKSSFAWVANIANTISLDWLDEYPEIDAARYSSFSSNAGAQFYKYTKPIDASKDEFKLDFPMLMVVSADDATIDPQAALDIFCAGKRSSLNTLIWYQSADIDKSLRLTDNTPPKGCDNNVRVILETIEPNARSFDGTKYFVSAIAHTATSISPKNKHYGVNGKYRQCLHYLETTSKFENCQKGSLDNLVVFAEKDKRDEIEASGKLYARGTFNPYFDEMLMEIIAFVEKTKL